MRKLLAVFILGAVSLLAAPPTVQQQQYRMEQQLKHWQEVYNAKALKFDIQVVMHPPIEGALGASEELPPGAPYDFRISILARENYPKFSNPRKIQRDQDNSLYHEFLHCLIAILRESENPPVESFVRTTADLVVTEK